jgi:hypothetical protein
MLVQQHRQHVGIIVVEGLRRNASKHLLHAAISNTASDSTITIKVKSALPFCRGNGTLVRGGDGIALVEQSRWTLIVLSCGIRCTRQVNVCATGKISDSKVMVSDDVLEATVHDGIFHPSITNT